MKPVIVFGALSLSGIARMNHHAAGGCGVGGVAI